MFKFDEDFIKKELEKAEWLSESEKIEAEKSLRLEQIDNALNGFDILTEEFFKLCKMANDVIGMKLYREH